MADGRIERNDIVTDEAIKNITTLKNEIESSAKALSDLTKQLTALNDSTGKYTVSSKALADYEKKLTDIEKELESTNNKLIESKKKHTAEVDKLSKAYILQAKEKQDAIKLAKAEAVANNELAGTEERQRARLAQLTIEKAKLRVEDQNYATTLDRIQKEMNELDAALIKTGSTMQKQKANVGNYTGANWELSNSINQLTREAPAFANSMNTGFMAISNNIPMFVEQLSNLREANKLLREDGQKTVPVWKQFLGAFISWNTALSFGVTLLTVYGGEMFKYVTNLFKTNDALEKQKKLESDISDIRKKTIESMVEEKTNLDILYNASQDQNRSLDERKKAVDELQTQYPSYFGNLKDEAILSGNAYDAYVKQANSILKVAESLAIKDKLTENSKVKLTLEEEVKLLESEYKRLNDINNKELDAVDKIERMGNISLELAQKRKDITDIDLRNSELVKKLNVESLTAKKYEKDLIDKLKKQKEDELEIYKKLADYYSKQQKDYIDLNEKKLTDDIKLIKSNDSLTANFIKNTRIQLTALREFIKTSDLSYKDQAEAQLKITSQLKELDDLEFQYMENRKLAGETSVESYLEEWDVAKQFSKDKEAEDKRKKRADEDEYARRQKIAELYQRTSEIAIAGMELYNAIIDRQITKQEYAKDKELKMAQRNYDKNIQFGMDEVQAKATYEAEKNSIEIKYQKKIDELKRKQAIWQKAQDISQILADGAMAQIAIWANPLTIITAPVLSGILATLTALQVAAVAVRPIPPVPEYWAGTQSHKGGLAVVGDRFGTEMIELPTGERYLTPNTATLVDMPERSKVIPNKDLLRELSNSGNENVKDLNGSKMIVDAINNKPFAQISLDKNGFSYYITKANERKKYIDKKYRN